MEVGGCCGVRGEVGGLRVKMEARGFALVALFAACYYVYSSLLEHVLGKIF